MNAVSFQIMDLTKWGNSWKLLKEWKAFSTQLEHWLPFLSLSPRGGHRQTQQEPMLCLITGSQAGVNGLIKHNKYIWGALSWSHFPFDMLIGSKRMGCLMESGGLLALLCLVVGKHNIAVRKTKAFLSFPDRFWTAKSWDCTRAKTRRRHFPARCSLL